MNRLRAERDASSRILKTHGDVARDVLIADVRHVHADVDAVPHNYRAGPAETGYRDVGHGWVDRDRHGALVVHRLVVRQRLTCDQVVIAGSAWRPSECERRVGTRDEAGDSLRANRHVLGRILQRDVERGDVLVADVFHGDGDARCAALHRRARSTDTRHGQVGQRPRRRRRKAVDHDAEAIEDEVDPIGDRDVRVSGEEQRHRIEIRVVGDDERA